MISAMAAPASAAEPHSSCVCVCVCSRLEGIQYPYHLYISPSARPGANGPDRPFQCPTCGVRFTRIQNLKQHMLIHSGTYLLTRLG